MFSYQFSSSFPDGFDILVNDCYAHNGANKRIQLIDHHGCPVDQKLISRFQVNTDGSTFLILFRNLHLLILNEFNRNLVVILTPLSIRARTSFWGQKTRKKTELFLVLGQLRDVRHALPDGCVCSPQDVQVHRNPSALHRVRRQDVPRKMSGKPDDFSLPIFTTLCLIISLSISLALTKLPRCAWGKDIYTLINFPQLITSFRS